ncbi:MAG: hypothetical protein HY071_06855 [Chloroflexi bacterium]|nr:hypothetical protein [Chloroflexota bacterium]
MAFATAVALPRIGRTRVARESFMPSLPPPRRAAVAAFPAPPRVYSPYGPRRHRRPMAVPLASAAPATTGLPGRLVWRVLRGRRG